VTSICTRNLGILVSLAAAGLLLTGRVSAHHGAAGLYDTTKSVMMKGTITKIDS
jgi:hypothetical protein